MRIPDEPLKMQQENRQTIMENLRDVYAALEKLIQKSYQRKQMDLNFQLRNLRSDVSRIVSGIENRDLDGFSGKKGTLDALYAAEEELLNSSAELLELASDSLLSENTDIILLESYLNRFEKCFKNRIIADRDILDEFRLKQMEISAESSIMSGTDILDTNKNAATNVEMEKKDTLSEEHYPETEIKTDDEVDDELDAGMLSKLYNYLNALEQKYSLYQPEVSYDGSYIADCKWSIDVSDRKIIGIVKDGVFKTPLTFETYWYPVDELREIMDLVQSEASSVAKGRYRSLCLVNSSWKDEIREWCKKYLHPRMMVFLYELDAGKLIFNEYIDSATSLAIWHDPEEKPDTLEDKLLSLSHEMEYFEISDLMKMTGLNAKSADRFLKGMVKKNRLIDVGFGSSKYTWPKE